MYDTSTETPSPYAGSIASGLSLVDNYTDLGFQLPNTTVDGNSVKQSFSNEKTYYFRCTFRKTDKYETTQTGIPADNSFIITLALRKPEESKDNLQVIDYFTIPAKLNDENEFFSYSIVFSPFKEADMLVLQVNRTVYDVLGTPENGNKGRNWLLEKENGVLKNVLYTGEYGELCQLNNIVPLSNNKKRWTRFGYQSRPGNLIVVNKSPMRVGRSGIYELNAGIDIDSFMIAAPQGSDSNNIDAFLLDYAYET